MVTYCWYVLWSHLNFLGTRKRGRRCVRVSFGFLLQVILFARRAAAQRMIPCRIVTDASQATDTAIPLSVYNPETNTTETAALVVETDGVGTQTPTEVTYPLSVVDFGAAQEDATVKYTNIKREAPETTEAPAVMLERPSLSSEMRFPLHHAGQPSVLNPSPTLASHQDFRVRHRHLSPPVVTGDHEKNEIHGSASSVGVFLPDSGEVQFIDAPPPPGTFGDASHLITNEAAVHVDGQHLRYTVICVLL